MKSAGGKAGRVENRRQRIAVGDRDYFERGFRHCLTDGAKLGGNSERRGAFRSDIERRLLTVRCCFDLLGEIQA